VQKDPFISFLSDLSKKIALEKDHKKIMEKIDSSNEEEIQEASPLEGFINTLKDKLTGIPVSEITPTDEVIKKDSESIEDIIKRDLESVVIETNEREEELPFNNFVSKLKDIFDQKPVTIETKIVSVSALEQKEEIKAVQPVSDKENKPSDYINELEKLKNSVAVEKEDSKITEIKKLIEEFAEKYVKKAIGHMGESGGGTNAVQYANGGTMNGDLNVNGNYLSGGVNLLDIFALQPDLDNQTLSYNDSNYNLSISNGNTVNLSSINTTTKTYSGDWNSVYSTVCAFSAAWGQDIQQLSFDNTNYNLSITNGNTVNLSALKDNLSDIAAASGNWNNTYTTLQNNSAGWESVESTVNTTSSYWADTRYDVTFGQNVTINGNLTALGTSTFKNTIFTTTSALSVYNTGPGPALYVFQAAGPYDVASFYDGDGVEVLHVGNANVNQGGKVGINESYPTVELTVNGQISANNIITALGGNSNQWNSNYTTTNSNSANWILDGGNTKGSNLLIGSNDSYHLSFETNNTTRARFLSSGQLGINKNNPTKTLDLSGNLQVDYAEGISPGVFVGGLYVRYPVTAPKDDRYNGYYSWNSTTNRYVSGANPSTQYYITSTIPGWSLVDASRGTIATNSDTSNKLVPPRFGWVNTKSWDSFDTAPTIQNTDYGVVVKETLSASNAYFNYIGNNKNFVIERLGLKNLTLTDNEGWRGGRTTISNTLCVAPADPTNYFDQPNIFFSDAGLFHATGPS